MPTNGWTSPLDPTGVMTKRIVLDRNRMEVEP
jgi:hypothetical protein